jgi:hypothetical protein
MYADKPASKVKRRQGVVKSPARDVGAGFACGDTEISPSALGKSSQHSALSIQPGNIREDQNSGRASVKSILLLLNSALRCVIPGNQRLGPKHEAGCAPAGAAASAANSLLAAKSSSGLERNDKMVGAKRNNLWSEAT